MTLRERLDRVLQAADDLEGAGVVLVAKVVPWLAPLPTAYLVYLRTVEHLGWPWWVGLGAAIAVESLGLVTTLTALEIWSYNATRRKIDPVAPLTLPLVLVATYFICAELLTVGLDVLPRWGRWIPAIFPFLTLVGVGVIAIRVDQIRRVRMVAEAAKERTQRQLEHRRIKCTQCKYSFPKDMIKDGLCPKCAGEQLERGRFSTDIKQKLTEREDWCCYYCGTNLEDREYHIDHFIPCSRGGTESLDNLVLSCPACNLLKSDRVPSEKEQFRFEWYRKAKATNGTKKEQVLVLASEESQTIWGQYAPTQSDIARLLNTSQGYVSTILSENGNGSKKK